MQMKSRTTFTVIVLGSLVCAIAAGVVAVRILQMANADQSVPPFMSSLMVAFLAVMVALLAAATAIRPKRASRRTSPR
jgi:hypothetical protein